MLKISEAFAIAVQHHQAGQLQTAEQIYRQILAVEPGHADALHLLGVIALQMNNFGQAIECISRAIELNGTEPAFHCNLGAAYKSLGNLDKAVDSCRRAVELDPGYATGYFNLGNALLAQGNLEEAIASFHAALDLKPDYATAHNNLGNIYQSQRKLDEAVASYRQALNLKPDFVEVFGNLGNALLIQGKTDEAIACFRRAVELRPDDWLAYYKWANALQTKGNLDQAVDAYRRVLELNPDHVEAHNNLGNALQAQGNLDNAIACFGRALQLKPDYAVAHFNLGNALQVQGKLHDAVESYRRALELNPHDAVAYYNMGNAFKDLGQLNESAACFRQAVQQKPDYAEAHNNLGTVLQAAGHVDDAMVCFRQALMLQPHLPQAHYNLGTAFEAQGKLDDAVDAYRRAVELKPDFAKAHSNLGNTLKDQGKLDAAVACFRRALQIEPGLSGTCSNLLLALQYRAGTTLPELFAAHAEFEQQHAAPLRAVWRPHDNDRDSERPLRLGFVSPDFGRHPVGFFLIRAVENLDRERFQTVCYSNRVSKDDLTGRFKSTATIWRDVHALSDEQLAEQIRADRIDVLFDLAGHTAKNRLLILARKPAPIQIAWAGYAGTTGLKAVDYILADRYEIPPQAEVHHAERVLRMPDGYVSYDPPAYAPLVSPLPAQTNGFFTFGSFNNRSKITDQVIEVWAKVLSRLPQSRLALRNKGINDSSIASGLASALAMHGIDPGRLECLGWSPHEELLAEYNRIDLALDTFPYNGGLTTCEALWMGVPVITCPGETFASRHSLSHLSSIGLTETITRDLDDYVELAVSLASDLPRLAGLRAGLRDRMAASPLCDGKRFADNLMGVLRDVWRQWCRESQP